MNQTEPNQAGIWQQLAALLHLWPAVLTVLLVMVMLPPTRPVLAALPERLSAPVPEAADELPETFEAELEEEPLGAVLDANYEDGIYTGSAQGYGGLITVQVTVEGGQITAIDILDADGETTSFFNRAMGVIGAVLACQTWEVDVISGATYSSRGILGAIQNALTEEQVENEAPKKESPVVSLPSDSFEKPEGGYRDGTYYGSATGFGGAIQVKVVISDGKITAISIVSAPGETGSYLSKAETVIGRILSADSPNVDTVSGATYSSNGIINAVKRALAQAGDPGTGDLTVTEEPGGGQDAEPPVQLIQPSKPSVVYKDGVYTGIGEGFGGDITVQVTISDGRITAVEVLSAEDETPAYLSRASTLLGIITTAQSAQVDVVSGATYSSNGILEAVCAALAQAAAETDQLPDREPDKTEEDKQDAPDTAPERQPDESGEETVYTDGSYTAMAVCTDDDLFCYQVQVSIDIADGKIAGIAVEKLEDISDDPEINETYLNCAINGCVRKDVWYEGVTNQILTGQSADGIDIVSSATYSSDAIITAAQKALLEAGAEAIPEPEPGGEPPDEALPWEKEPEEEPGEKQPGDPEEGGTDEPLDGTCYTPGSYTAVAVCTDDALFCYQVRVTITVIDGRIMGVAAEKLEDTSDDPEANEAYLDYALNGRIRRGVWYTGVSDQILAAQSADEVDIVSGATYSTHAVAEAARKALHSAKVEAEG